MYSFDDETVKAKKLMAEFNLDYLDVGMNFNNLVKLFNIDIESATVKDIEHGYRQLALKYHPDKHSTLSKNQRDIFSEEFKKLEKLKTRLIDNLPQEKAKIIQAKQKQEAFKRQQQEREKQEESLRQQELKSEFDVNDPELEDKIYDALFSANGNYDLIILLSPDDEKFILAPKSLMDNLRSPWPREQCTQGRIVCKNSRDDNYHDVYLKGKTAESSIQRAVSQYRAAGNKRKVEILLNLTLPEQIKKYITDILDYKCDSYDQSQMLSSLTLKIQNSRTTDSPEYQNMTRLKALMETYTKYSQTAQKTQLDEAYSNEYHSHDWHSGHEDTSQTEGRERARQDFRNKYITAFNEYLEKDQNFQAACAVRPSKDVLTPSPEIKEHQQTAPMTTAPKATHFQMPHSSINIELLKLLESARLVDNPSEPGKQYLEFSDQKSCDETVLKLKEQGYRMLIKDGDDFDFRVLVDKPKNMEIKGCIRVVEGKIQLDPPPTASADKSAHI